jgi:hypothetical protein
MQQLAAMQAQQAATTAAAPAADGGARLQQLAQLTQAGVLSDGKFAGTKAKLLAQRCRRCHDQQSAPEPGSTVQRVISLAILEFPT